jgi:uncharacterized protein YndB with AHSA1/START domain
MEHDIASAEAVVTVARTYRAPQARVFAALTRPALLAEWFARAPGTPPARVVTLDVRPGGRYLIEVVSPKNGQTYGMRGVYREVLPPERLSFTWWYDQADFAESLVTIELRAVDAHTTELVLTHALLPAQAREGHRQGWEECLTSMETALRATSAMP